MNGKFFSVNPTTGSIIYRDDMKDQAYGFFNMTTVNTEIVSQNYSLQLNSNNPIYHQPPLQFNQQQQFNQQIPSYSLPLQYNSSVQDQSSQHSYNQSFQQPYLPQNTYHNSSNLNNNFDISNPSPYNNNNNDVLVIENKINNNSNNTVNNVEFTPLYPKLDNTPYDFKDVQQTPLQQQQPFQQFNPIQQPSYNPQSDYTPPSSSSSPLVNSDIKDFIFTALNLFVSAFHKQKGFMIWKTTV